MSYIIYIYYELQKQGGALFVAEKKVGRPTTNPKTTPRQIRLDNECKEILERYCMQESISESEGIRRGIKKLKSDLK